MAANPAQPASRNAMQRESYRREEEKVRKVKALQDHVFQTTGKRPSFADALLQLERQEQDDARVQLELKARRATATLSEEDPAEASRQLHAAVASFREENPDTSYSEALVIVSRERKRKARFATVRDTLGVDSFHEPSSPGSFLDTHNRAVAMQRRFSGLRYSEAVLHVRNGTEPKRKTSPVPMARSRQGGRDHYRFSDAESDFVCMGAIG